MTASKRATIYDVAKAAGVSITTVSFVLNRPDRVRPATRERVLAAADALDYAPRSEAVVRARAALGRIGVVAPFTSYASYYRRLSGVIEVVGDDARDVCVFDHESAATAQSPLLGSLPISDRLDGMIVMGLALEPAISDRLTVRGVPTVVVDAPSMAFSSVRTDDAEGGRIAARHLLDLGHRRIGYVTERHGRHPVPLQADARLAGFQEIVDALGSGTGEVTVCAAAHDIEAARITAAGLLALRPRPTAIVGNDDLLAAGAMLAVRAAGLRIPEDMSVMGFDDGDLAAGLGLSTIRQPFEESGRSAADLLLHERAARESPRRVVTLGLTLVPRLTTGPAPG
ncbi:MAG: LacI family DNA-binding transcriptional regulator [Chloroflexi bacterium]|nr:LacI family DNA-binding transcriptional regulator [Chloroflexota bacterium]